MKAKVIRRFIDKYTKNLHEIGDVLEINDERFAELSGEPPNNFVKEIKEDKPTKEHLESMAKKELVDFASKQNIELNMRMTKDEMIKEIKGR